MEMSELLKPAIHYAQEGYPVTEVIANDWALQNSIFQTAATMSQITRFGEFPNNFDEFMRVFLPFGPGLVLTQKLSLFHKLYYRD